MAERSGEIGGERGAARQGKRKGGEGSKNTHTERDRNLYENVAIVKDDRRMSTRVAECDRAQKTSRTTTTTRMQSGWKQKQGL